MTDNQPYVSIRWDENTYQFTAEFIKDYKVVEWKRLTVEEEEALSIYLTYEHDHTIDIPAKEFWERFEDGDLLLDEDGNFLSMLSDILSQEEATK